MNHLEIAQTLAEQFDAHTHEEIEAMLHITCLTHKIEMSWLLPVVSNLYAKISKPKPVNYLNGYSESEAR